MIIEQFIVKNKKDKERITKEVLESLTKEEKEKIYSIYKFWVNKLKTETVISGKKRCTAFMRLYSMIGNYKEGQILRLSRTECEELLEHRRIILKILVVEKDKEIHDALELEYKLVNNLMNKCWKEIEEPKISYKRPCPRLRFLSFKLKKCMY
ncbi:MAG: hypothetical protein ACRC4M_02350 [Mycoplasma sp.]